MASEGRLRNDLVLQEQGGQEGPEKETREPKDPCLSAQDTPQLSPHQATSHEKIRAGSGCGCHTRDVPTSANPLSRAKTAAHLTQPGSKENLEIQYEASSLQTTYTCQSQAQTTGLQEKRRVKQVQPTKATRVFWYLD